MSFDSNVNCEPTLLMDGSPKNVKNCFLKLCQLFQRLIYVRLHNKSQQGCVTPNGLHGEAVESFSGYARSQVDGLAMVLFRCLAIFFNCCCPLRSVTTTLLTWKIASSVCLSVTHQHLLRVHVIFGLREISLVVISEKTYREDTAFWEVFSPDTLFFTWETVVNFKNLAALRQHLLNSG